LLTEFFDFRLERGDLLVDGFGAFGDRVVFLLEQSHEQPC
jgi:hypothetical protein